MTIQELLNRGVEQLDAAGIEDALFNARELMISVSGLDKTKLFLQRDDILPEAAVKQYNDKISLRCTGYPLQYILGEWDFYGLTLTVDEGVLIPRPETEQLVEQALSRMELLRKKVGRPLEVLDLCAGSGCIGLAVASQFPDCRVTAIEKSERALAVLKKNVKRTGIRSVTILSGDILDGFGAFSLPQPDVLLSNPPYVASGEMNQLQTEVRFEPVLALEAGDDGLCFYRCLARQWLPFLRKGGFCAVECGDGQAETIEKIFSAVTPKTSVSVDFAGIERIVQAEL